MRRESVFSSITLFVLVLIASVHSQTRPEPRLDDAANLGSNLNGSTITVTPSSNYDVYCYRQNIQKDWYKINGETGTKLPRNLAPGSNVYVNRIEASGTETLALHFKPFQSSDIGEYECGITPTNGPPFSTLSIYLTTPTPGPTPAPMLPSKVQGVSVTRTVQDSSPALSVSWSAVSESGITYTVCYSTTSRTQSDPPSGADCSTSGITGTSTTLGPLSKGATYYIWVAAVSSGRRGPYSDRRQERTYQVPSRVNPPSLTKRVRSGKPAIGVTWTAPSSERTITTYRVRYRPRGGSWSIKDVTSTSTTLENLSAGTSYEVQVRAVSDIGFGSYSEIEAIFTYRVPSQVGRPVLTKAASSGRPALEVAWTGLAGEHPNIRYQVQYKRSVSTSWSTKEVTSTSTTLENLSAGTSYQVRVRAVSDVGIGSYSSMRTITTYQVPSQVGPPVLTKAASSGRPALTVTWTALAGEHPNIRYQVQYRISGSTSWSTKDVTSTSTTLENLSAGTSYQVQVRAVSDVRAGQYSPIRTNTTYRVPEQVTGVGFTLNDTNNVLTLTITWDSPSSELPITHYLMNVVEQREQRTTRVVGETTLTIPVTPGSTYTFRVQAVSAVGFGAWSESVTAASASVTAPSTTTLTVRWNDEGFSYRLHVQKKGSTEINTFRPVTPPYNITGLESNTEYTVVVEAYNSPGSANGSGVGYTLPEVPVDLVLEVLSSTSIRVTWTPPPNAERLPLTYHVGYSSEFTAERSTSTTERSLVLTGLHPFDDYIVTVEAENKGGRGGPITKEARTLSDVPSEAPGTPTTGKVRSRSALLQWSIPPKSGRNGIITQYRVDLSIKFEQPEYRNVRNITVSFEDPSFDEPPTITHNVTDLTPFTVFYFRVAAVNDAGVGPFSPYKPFTTRQDFPGPVSNLSYQITSNTSAKIMWSEPEEPNGNINGYDVTFGDYGNYSRHTMESVTITKKELMDLSPETPINVTVQAKNTVGVGKPNSVTLFTEEGVPTVAPKNVTVVRINNTAISVSWNPLTLHEARGWPVYMVFWESSSQRAARAVPSVNTSNSSVVIGNLDPASHYSVVVQVSTVAGTREELRSQPVVVEPTPTITEQPSSSVVGVVMGILVVVVVMIVVTVVIILLVVFVYKSRRSPSKSFSPSQSENDIEMKSGGKGLAPLKPKPAQQEDSGSISDIHTKAVNVSDNVNVLTVATSLGEPVTKSQFAAHVKLMHKERDSGFEKEYQTITNDPEGCETIAKANRTKNRYLNIHTYDHSRVVLSVPEENGNDYINASYIDGYQRENAYIASQGPTSTTVGDFWRMVYDHQCPVIVMLTRVEEKGRRKCEMYWQEDLNVAADKGRGIMITTVKFKMYADYEVREIVVFDTFAESDATLTVKHFLYTGWPDHGVPQHPASLVKFTQKVRRAYQQSPAPLLIHCSAGVGRTGTFITIDAMMQRMKEKDDLNIYEFVTHMRTKRTFMVQNQDQYVFIHDALADYITCGNTSILAQELLRSITEMTKVDQQTKKDGFMQQFQFLETLSKAPCGEDTKFAKKHIIAKKNRYKDRYPYSTAHLHISGRSPNNGGDYINASYMDSYSQQNAFIAAQSPMNSTLFDFWELLWQFKPPTVVLLCNFVENKQESCVEFWPNEKQRGADYGIMRVNHKSTQNYDGYDEYKLEVLDKRKDNCTPYKITLFHFRDWPIDGPPPYLPSLLKMMGDVESAHKGTTKPLLVACNDGMARTGVFIAAMSEVERVKAEGEIDLFQTVKAARSKRPHMISTPEQYQLCFNILQAYLDSFDTYANFKVV